MKNLCESAVNIITDKLINDKAIDINERDVYKFGIEVMILKTIHIISYFVIAFCMKKMEEFIVIFIIFYMFRRNTGGFHAKTRIGCYLFSCFAISLSLFTIELSIDLRVMMLITVIDLMIILLLAPVQVSNRKLYPDEINSFRHRLIIVSIIFVIIYAVAIGTKRWHYLTLYTVGLSLETFLTVLGKMQSSKLLDM